MEMILIEKADFLALLSKIDSISSRLEKLTSDCDEKIYNVTQAAEIIGVTPQTLHAYIRAGYVTPLKINGSNKFTKKILESLKK